MITETKLTVVHPSTLVLCRTDIDYNNANCAGQNGVSNAAAVQGGPQYSGGILTTTGGDAMTTPTLTSTSSTSAIAPVAV